MSQAPETAARSLTDDELRQLEERERQRMSEPDYRRNLQDPTAVIAALTLHHGDR